MRLGYPPWGGSTVMEERRDAVSAQPWLPDGPIPHEVTWRMPGYEPAEAYPHPSPAGEPRTGEPQGTAGDGKGDKVAL